MAHAHIQQIPLEYIRRVTPGGQIEFGRLVLTTYKNVIGGGITSEAQVEIGSDGFFFYKTPGDFYKCLKQTTASRVTQKSIFTQHAKEFTPEGIATLHAEIRQHYVVRAAESGVQVMA